ncbi:hypothetical protein AB2B41_05255 [Marimonas sp. MJW-29]|uniref:Uncharacterized protein n=1 Tax=Sulfitobacter sediminis TaxID=3234186 RepID=A0ABV3RJ57_9RHOB
MSEAIGKFDIGSGGRGEPTGSQRAAARRKAPVTALPRAVSGNTALAIANPGPAGDTEGWEEF